jgi:hypothetical protein
MVLDDGRWSSPTPADGGGAAGTASGGPARPRDGVAEGRCGGAVPPTSGRGLVLARGRGGAALSRPTSGGTARPGRPGGGAVLVDERLGGWSRQGASGGGGGTGRQAPVATTGLQMQAGRFWVGGLRWRDARSSATAATLQRLLGTPGPLTPPYDLAWKGRVGSRRKYRACDRPPDDERRQSTGAGPHPPPPATPVTNPPSAEPRAAATRRCVSGPALPPSWR